MNEAAALLDAAREQLWIGLLIFLRVGAFTSLLPGFGEQSVPPRVKLVIALMLTVLVVTFAPALTPPAVAPGPFLRFLATETLIGLALGLALRVFVLALQTAGMMIGQAMSLSQILGNAGVEPMPAVGHVLVIGGLALAMMMGLHVHALLYVLMSYEVLPAGHWPDAARMADWGTRMIAQSFQLAFSLAAPFAIVSLIYNVTLGAINRAMPQLMVALVGAPAITFGALALMWLLAPHLLEVWANRLFAFLMAPF